MGKKRKKTSPGVLADNRKARFEFQVLEEVECGMQLLGTEVKALREGGGSFADSYVHMDKGEAWLEGFHIRGYSSAAAQAQHDPTRTRKLLLSKKDIERLGAATKQKGLTMVPLRVYLKGRWVKLAVGLAKGKKLYDKRRDEKERIVKREMSRALKERSR